MIEKPRNTSSDDPLLHLGGLMGGNDEYIYGMEAQGQNQLVNSESLPSEMGDRSKFEELGFEFGEVFEDDPMFIRAKLPEGWKKQGTDHSMHSEIVDERGFKRVSIFYKAAFYDRRADMHLVDPGRDFANKFIYGEIDELPVDKFTEEERALFEEACNLYLDNVKRHPDIYGDREPRARRALDIIKENK